MRLYPALSVLNTHLDSAQDMTAAGVVALLRQQPNRLGA